MFVWNIDPDLFTIPGWGRGIRYYGLLFAIGLMGGYYLWQWQVERSGRRRDVAEAFLVPGVISVVAGTRLMHCLFYQPEIYLSNPIRILYFWEGGLSSHGGAVGLMLAIYWYKKRYGMPFAQGLDCLSMPVAWAATMIRIGNLMNSEIVGRVSDGPIGFKFPRHDHRLLEPCMQKCGEVASDVCGFVNNACVSFAQVPYRHPSQIYEALWGLTVLGGLYLIDRTMGAKRPMGILGFGLLAVYFGGRIFIEQFKEYQGRTAGLTEGQILSIPVVLIGLGGLAWAIKRGLPAPPAPPEAT